MLATFVEKVGIGERIVMASRDGSKKKVPMLLLLLKNPFILIMPPILGGLIQVQQFILQIRCRDSI